MAVGDLKYVVTSTGFGIKEEGSNSDPNSTVLPTIISNAHPSDKVIEFEVELFVNTSIIDTQSGANTVYSSSPVFDIANVSINGMIPGASRLDGSTMRVFDLLGNGRFIDEAFTWSKSNIIPSANGQTIETTSFDTVQGSNTVYSNTAITNVFGDSLVVNTSFLDTYITNETTTSEFIPEEYFVEEINTVKGMSAVVGYTPEPDEIFVNHSGPAIKIYPYTLSVDVTKLDGNTPVNYEYTFDAEWDAERALALIQQYTST